MLLSYIKRLVQHLPQLKNKNQKLKDNAQNLLDNINILMFIKRENIYAQFNLIKHQYQSNFPKFIKYFKRNYFEKYPLYHLDLDYDISNNLNPIVINHYFFTNNICDTTNKALNMNYKGACKTLLALENAIKELICLY